MKKIVTMLLILSAALWSGMVEESRQLIVVTTNGWNENTGSLQRYERDTKGWHPVGDLIAVKLGRSGLGWGIGLHKIPKDAPYIKREGDGRSPAGIFALKQAFGYAPFVVRYPYEVYRVTNHCVDDVNSSYYNKIVDVAKVKRDYRSFEHMKFPKNYYEYGIVVNHNHIDEPGAVPGAGSCIFLHIKKVPTTGCTAMGEAQIKEIIQWLDERKYPLLVQGPKKVVKVLMKKFDL